MDKTREIEKLKSELSKAFLWQNLSQEESKLLIEEFDSVGFDVQRFIKEGKLSKFTKFKTQQKLVFWCFLKLFPNSTIYYRGFNSSIYIDTYDGTEIRDINGNIIQYNRIYTKNLIQTIGTVHYIPFCINHKWGLMTNKNCKVWIPAIFDIFKNYLDLQFNDWYIDGVFFRGRLFTKNEVEEEFAVLHTPYILIPNPEYEEKFYGLFLDTIFYKDKLAKVFDVNIYEQIKKYEDKKGCLCKHVKEILTSIFNNIPSAFLPNYMWDAFIDSSCTYAKRLNPETTEEDLQMLRSELSAMQQDWCK